MKAKDNQALRTKRDKLIQEIKILQRQVNSIEKILYERSIQQCLIKKT